jgi:hypothetical protein
MANRFSMAKVNAILVLHQLGHSNRRIAKLWASTGGGGQVPIGLAAENQPNTTTGS